MKANIPSLGQTSEEVIKNALNYNTAGFLLKFTIVGEGCFIFNQITNKYEALLWHGNIPLKLEQKSSFDSYLAAQVKKGFVSIFVDAPGRKPWYSKEIHRATGSPLNA